MLRRTQISAHAGAHKRPYLLKDPQLSSRSGPHLKRQGLHGVQRLLQYGKTDSKNYEHAFPILTHTDFGHQNHLNNTHWVELANYLPKRTKGAPPWFRGADTYSVLYSEQGRYEYQRYLMVARMPSEFRTHFLRYLGNIRDVSIKQFGDGRPVAIPQEVLHWLLRMIVENFNPQHIHYSAAIATLANVGEFEMAGEVWKIMERQQTIPDDKLLVQYIDVLAKLREKTLAIECWNRYCSEKRFLQPGEVDPKPVSRVPFSLSRDETLYLPKWKKHFDHDPNLDVIDLNRFNTTRDIYRAMAGAMLASGDQDMFNYFFKELQTNLFSTPTPVPEPPNPLLTPAPTWGPHLSQDLLKRSPWRAKNSLRGAALGPSGAASAELHRRFQSNAQFFLTSVAHFFDVLSEQSPTILEVTQLYNDSLSALGSQLSSLDTSAFLTAYLRCLRIVKGVSADDSFLEATKLMAKKGSKESLPATAYLEVLRCLNSKPIETEAAARAAISTLQRILDSTGSTFRWSTELHFAVMQTLVKAGTMRANTYFVKNVLRQFQWDSTFCELLYEEYRRSSSAELWAELTKRLLVWTARYDVTLSERFKRMVEEDFDVIQVQVRTFRELAIFRYRDAEEKRIAAQPTAQLPNTFTDYVSHALPFPDRDTGTVNEYGELGQWRTPELGGPLQGVNGARGPARFAPELYGESKKSYMSEWVDPRARTGLPKLPAPWDRKYAQYARGTNPSYDQEYAGPFPEIFPERFNFRRITRWDFKDIEQQTPESMPPPPSSLVKYDNAVLLTEAKKARAARLAKAAKSGDRQVAPQTEDVLNSILPPREFEESGQRWVQFVSTTPATRLDVINLQERLDSELLQRQARETGICPIREELYAQAFDEVIRQVAVNCAERGLLLLRVRDEIRMTLAAYRTLYESSVAFGMRKALHAEQAKVDMQATIRNLEREKEDLERQVSELSTKCEAIERREAERRAADEKKHSEEISFYRKTHQTMTANLQTVINPGKK